MAETENTTAMLEYVKSKIAESPSIVQQRLGNVLIEREVERRVEMLDRAIAKLGELRKSEAKIKPDNITMTDSGEKQTSFTKAKYDERQKLREKLAKLEKAIDNALAGTAPDAFQKLKEAIDKAG